MKPKQIAVQLYWKGTYGQDQRACAQASSMSLLDEGTVKTISVALEKLPATVKGAFEMAERTTKDEMAVEIFVQDEHSRITFHSQRVSISNCHFVKDLDRFLVTFHFKELRRNETFVLDEKDLTGLNIENDAYGTEIESLQEE